MKAATAFLLPIAVFAGELNAAAEDGGSAEILNHYTLPPFSVDIGGDAVLFLGIIHFPLSAAPAGKICLSGVRRNKRCKPTGKQQAKEMK